MQRNFEITFDCPVLLANAELSRGAELLFVVGGTVPVELLAASAAAVNIRSGSSAAAPGFRYWPTSCICSSSDGILCDKAAILLQFIA